MEKSLPEEHPQLGRLLTEHPASYNRLFLTTIGWGVPMLGFVGYMLWALYGPGAMPREPITMKMLAAGALLIWLFFTGMAAWETGPTVGVYERGFLHGREPFPWESINAFFQQKFAISKAGIRVNTSHDYTVRRADGKKAKFYLGIERADELAETIQQRITPRLLDAARRDVAAGKTVDFGCVQLDKQALQIKSRSVADGQVRWTEFRDIQVDGMSVKIRKQGAWFGIDVPTRNVANLQVMLALIDELIPNSQNQTGHVQIP